MHSGLPPLPRGKADVNTSRTVKRGIRNVKDGVRGDGDDLTDIRSSKLTDRVHELNSLSKHVERPSEQADDSEVFHTLAQKGAEMAKRVAAGKGRSVNDFIRHLKASCVDDLDAQQEGEIDPHAFNWERLSRRIAKYFKYTPGVSCMLGPLDAQMKIRKQVQRIQRKPVGEVVAPKVLDVRDLAAQEQRDTEKNMEAMWEELRKFPNGVGFLELVMNTECFAQFCENCFTLSFLIHNKRARLAKSDNDNKEGLKVFPYNEKAARQDGNAKALDQDRAQFILSYSTKDWEEWKRYVRREDCCMPHRSAPEEDDAARENAAGPSTRPGESVDAEDDSVPDTENHDPPPRRKASSRKRISGAASEAAQGSDGDSQEGESGGEESEEEDVRPSKGSRRGGKRRK